MAATRIISADRFSDEAGCVMHGGVLHAVSVRTTTTIQAGTVASGATVSGTTSVGAPTVTSTLLVNAAALNTTGGAANIHPNMAFAGTDDHFKTVLVLPVGAIYTTDADYAPTPAQLAALRGVEIVTVGADVTITLPTAAAIVAAFPNITVNQAFTFPVANAGGATMDIIFAPGLGGAITAGTYDRFADAEAGSVCVIMTNVGAGTEAYNLVVMGNA